MKEYIIDVSRIEELQTLNDVHELEKIFAKAQSTIVNGEIVFLVRKTSNGPAQKFDELSTLEELQQYRNSVFRYISQ
jgi:hypothetical protein